MQNAAKNLRRPISPSREMHLSGLRRSTILLLIRTRRENYVARWQGKRVCLSGEIGKDQGKPGIILSDPKPLTE
jgi:hypothetical protein